MSLLTSLTDRYNAIFNENAKIKNTWHRTASGMYEAYMTNVKKPPKQVLQEARRKAKPDATLGYILAQKCPMCERTYESASVIHDLGKHGLCSYCYEFTRGKFPHVKMRREPTIDEALAAPIKTHVDAIVLGRAYLELKESCNKEKLSC